ncbi:hypothetical protein SAMN00017477_0937 [Peptoniphilus asaccharolyticus DSM 20463]|uniref:Uncharacterized protein n=1 Tax=Peptoniphilus asaccharolyticus DSM 20463 TaxID=573058 RepID=A0A1W1V035_PEPAS|nr:hypothetical protein [Peptoniphilus asaccharolyticus]MBL7575430.1 hypothetical protein [Peptoniphilus asaccharolyticus]SMB86693.1 hypothetical protein SAMN00017477_0937 [Peptoniphilus asaccharolyticus DSM 20463]
MRILTSILKAIIVVSIMTAFNWIFRNRENNSLLNKIYIILVTIFWILAVIVTGLLYWAGVGYIMEGNSSVGIKLLVTGVVMTLSVGSRVYFWLKK